MSAINPAQRFWALLKPDQKEITNLYLYAIFHGLVYLSLPLGIQAIINLIQGGQISTSWVILIVLVIAGIGASGLLQIAQLKITEGLQQKILTRSAIEFSYRIPRIKQEALAGKNPVELMNRFFDTVSVQKGLSKLLIDLSTAIIQMIFGLLLLALYHPFFVLFSMATVVALWLIFRFSYRKGMESSLRESKHKYLIAHWLEEIARNKQAIKITQSSEFVMQRTNNEVENYLNARDSHFKVLLKQYGLMVLFKIIMATGLLAIGGILVMEQQMNIGQFVAAEIIILLIMSSSEKIIMSMEVIYDVLTSLEKIGQVTDLQLEQQEGLSLDQKEKTEALKIEIQNLSLTENSASVVVKDINLLLKPGELVQLHSYDDQARKLFAEMITGQRDITTGNISINGLPIQNLDLAYYRSKIAFISRRDQLLDTTLLDNITLGRPGISISQVTALISNLGLSSFVDSLPNGYYTVMPTDERYLPKATIKKILIARSLISAPLLILAGDIFGDFDPHEKKKILSILTEQPHTPTIIFLTNDEALKSLVTAHYMFDNGQFKKI